MLYQLLKVFQIKVVSSMFYPNFYTYNRRPYYPNNMYNFNTATKKNVKKDIESNNDTIPFNSDVCEKCQDNSHSLSLFGLNLEVDDLILIGLIILLFMQSDKNYALIIILGLILLNVNLSDILNLF